MDPCHTNVLKTYSFAWYKDEVRPKPSLFHRDGLATLHLIAVQEFVFGMGSSVDACHADSLTLQPGEGYLGKLGIRPR